MRHRAVLIALIGAAALVTAFWSVSFERLLYGPPRPLPEVLRSFALNLPEGARDVSYKDLGRFNGDAAMIRFTATEQQLLQFTSTLRTGSGGSVALEKSGLRWIDAEAGEDAGWELDEITQYSSAQVYSGKSGSFYGGQISILVDERKGPSRLVVYLSALKA
ncbi:hypothetical protein [Streptomyces sp. NBC_01751]|uniref:hypothetical protein n=1 Tax=Streptomyces sp. NBC_01751 TaxID=2975929 RepID=UPI002DDBF006|nr:hypothetical protein [Streptomyces sp. NBC_01751]WSD27862.1 hypothetical protein OHA26_32660 [Streptomyces sp. NBC_01751]